MNTSNIVTDTQYGPFICGIVMLILCILGLIANLISLFIFTRNCMRSSINVFLAGLSSIDAVVLLFAIPTFVIPNITEIDGLVTIALFGLYQISMMAQTCSVWTFVLISMERYLAVVHPFIVQRCLTVKRARLAQLSVAIGSILYNLIRFWEYELIGPDGTFQRGLRGNSLYFALYYTSLYLLSHFLIPFLLIAVLNIFILSAIKRAQNQRTKLTYRQTQQKKTTQMIVIVTAVFAVCNTLPFVLNIWEALRPTLFNPDDNLHSWAFLILDVSNVLVVLNSSTTACIYLVYCQKYRNLWIYYMMKYCLGRSSTAIDRLMVSESEMQQRTSSCSLRHSKVNINGKAISTQSRRRHDDTNEEMSSTLLQVPSCRS